MPKVNSPVLAAFGYLSGSLDRGRQLLIAFRQLVVGGTLPGGGIVLESGPLVG